MGSLSHTAILIFAFQCYYPSDIISAHAQEPRVLYVCSQALLLSCCPLYNNRHTHTSLCNSQETLLPFGSDSYFLDGSPSRCEPQLRLPAISHSATCTGHLSLPPACHYLPGRWMSAGAGAHPSSAPLSQVPSSRGAML